MSTIKTESKTVNRAEKNDRISTCFGATPNNVESAIVAAISSMGERIVSSIGSLKSTMTDSFVEMKDSIDQLVIEEGRSEENEESLEIAAKTDQQPAQQSDKKQKSGSAVSNNGAKKPTTSPVTTERSINTLTNQSSEAQSDAPGGKIELLSGIANDLKLDEKKAPAINEQIANIVHGLMRESFRRKSSRRHRTTTTRQKTANVSQARKSTISFGTN